MSRNQKEFVHLHVHSEYSLLDGLSRIDDLVQRAIELNQPALALTDHGAMYGAMPFYRACRRAGIKPIIGIETYLAARRMENRDAQLDKNRSHMLLLAQNQTGYLNLLQIASTAQLEGYYYKPRIDREFMAQHSQGLIATTGCMAAEIPRAIQAGKMKLAHKLMGQYLDIFGPDRFFVELQEHSIPELTDINKTLVEMASRYNLRFLATNDVHYTRAEDADPHDILLCVQTSALYSDPKRMRFSDKGYYLKSYDEMHSLFGHIPGALKNSRLIAEMCDVNLDFEGYHLPDFEVPEGFDASSYLRHLCEQGLVERYGEDRTKSDEALRQRLDHELAVINRMGFATYFLIVWDLCQWAARSDAWWQKHRDPHPYSSYEEWKKNDIWFNVRGSGAGSVVAYTLGITCIEPLANGLIFERFLNPGRVSMPDIDLDYPDDVRHEMVEYTMRRYGHERVAQIITFGTMGARAAIRDVGRALDMSLPEVDAIARMIPAIPGKPAKIDNVLDKEHEFYSAELEERYKKEKAVKELVDTARNLEGVARHASSHAAGVIISDKPLHEYVPLNRPTSGDAGLGGLDRVTQWPMEIVESIGLLKVDFLGLSTLTIMRRAARIIEERYGVVYTMDNIPYDVGHEGPDQAKQPEKLFEMLSRGQVAGVFQVEGPGMRRLMMEMKPRRLDHIIAAISLYRPGPMENIPEYIRRMHAEIFEGKNIVEYHTPALEPILKDTYGILVYQEQIIRIASELAGYEPGEADIMRKAVGKKNKKLLDENRAKFTKGATANGLSREVCDAIWGDIEFFARYGFNKAHAADYAKVTCQTAFLKAHYPVEYLCAMLSVERDKTDKVRRYFTEAKNLAIEVVPPDVNLSQLDFSIEDDPQRPTIRFGLGAIKNAGEGALQLILEDREKNGSFQSLQDLCERVDLRRVGKRALEYMIKARAFDCWGTPAQLIDALDRMISYSGNIHSAAAVGQMSLFGGPALQIDVEILHPDAAVTPVPHKQLLEWEKEALGVHVSEHPLERPLALLRPHTNTTIGEIDANWNGKLVKVAGMISQLRTLTTKRGDPMAFGTLEDLDDKVDVVFFPRTWKQCRADVKVDQVMLVTGKVQAKEEDQITVIADRVDTNLEIGQEADAAQVTARRDLNRPAPANGHNPDTSPPVVMPERVLPQSAAESRRDAPTVLPPPPNFDDNWSTTAEPTLIATAIGDIPAEPQTTPPGNGQSSLPDPAPAPPSGNGKTQTVVIEIRPVSNWRETCRDALRQAEKYEGSDALRLSVPGQGLVMDFPNHQTQVCPELLEDLRLLPGVARVFRS